MQLPELFGNARHIAELVQQLAALNPEAIAVILRYFGQPATSPQSHFPSVLCPSQAGSPPAQSRRSPT